jgi:hypothetical protein
VHVDGYKIFENAIPEAPHHIPLAFGLRLAMLGAAFNLSNPAPALWDLF